MRKKCTLQMSRSLPTWTGLALAAAALILSLVLLASLVSAAEPPLRPLEGRLPAVPSGVNEWTPLGGPVVEGGQVNAVAVHPAISDTVYAAVALPDAHATGPSWIYKTTNGGAWWTPVYTAGHQVYSLAVTGTRVYAGAFNPGGEGTSIYASHDSGGNWMPVFSFPERGVWTDMAIHSTDSDIAIACGWLDDGSNRDEGLVYGTDNGGLAWSSLLTVTIPGENSSVNAVLIHPFTATLVLAAARVGDSSDTVIYRSEDGGTTWPGSFTINGAHVVSLVAHATDPKMLFAGTGKTDFSWGPNRVYRSTDAGLSWTEVSAHAGGLLAFEPPATVYALVEPLWASTANGAPGTWAIVEDFWPGPQISLDIDVGTSPANLYVGGGWVGVSKGTNGGTNWTGASGGIATPVKPHDIAVDPQDLDKLFVAAECLGGWMTVDGGGIWTEPSGLYGCRMSFAINPQDTDIVYAGGMNGDRGAVSRSGDGGLTFETVYTATYILPDGSGGSQIIPALAIALSMPDTVYAAGWDSPAGQDDSAVIIRSPDDGDSWTEVFTLPSRSAVEVLAINPANKDVIYAGGLDCHTGPCQGFVYRTIDGGERWTPVLTTDRTVRSVVIDTWNPSILYASTDGNEIHKSTDGGDGWTRIRECCPSGNLLAIDPHVPSHVYLGGWGYIAETTNGGGIWSEWGDPLNNGTPEMSPSALTVDNDPVTQTLYAGFSGVWAYSRPAPQPYTVYLPVVRKD